jgi:ATP-dependent HslUV protease ATP-binding subunit HslU
MSSNNADNMTPREIVAELDKYIVGQDKAKRAVAIALRNRYRRRLLSDELRDEVIPKNILMIGPTGVGKTEIARRLANLASAPFLKIEATKFTEVGYVGRDVDSMVRDLVQVAVRMVEAEKIEEIRPKAQEQANDMLLDLLAPAERRKAAERMPRQLMEAMEQTLGRLFPDKEHAPEQEDAEEPESEDYVRTRAEQRERLRDRLRTQLAAGELDDRVIEIEVEDTSSPFMQVFSQQGMEEMGVDMPGILGSMMPKRHKKRKASVLEAREILTDQAAREMLDQDQVVREAVERTEQSGIIFVDEMDKIAGREHEGGPQVSREGVQRDILPIIEGSTVITKYGPVSTNHILFVAAGAFHVSKPSDLIPELQGRLPIRVELDSLTETDLKRILTEPRNALVKQYVALLAVEDVNLQFTDDAIEEIARIAARVNSSMENIGARRLHTIMERLLDEVSFQAPDVPDRELVVDAAYVRTRLEDIVKDEDLSRYIL